MTWCETRPAARRCTLHLLSSTVIARLDWAYLSGCSYGTGCFDEGDSHLDQALTSWLTSGCSITHACLQMLPPLLRPSSTDMTAAVAWAATGGFAALFLVQVRTQYPHHRGTCCQHESCRQMLTLVNASIATLAGQTLTTPACCSLLTG